MKNTNHRPLVLLVTNESQVFLTHRREIGLEVVRRGLRFAVVAPPNHDVAQAVKALGMGYIDWPLARKGMNPAQELASIMHLVSIYKRLRPRLVHHVTPKPVMYGGIAARIARIPAVVNAVAGLGYSFSSESPPALRLLVEALHRLSHRGGLTRTIFQNPEDMALFLSRGITTRRRARLILGSGVDLRRFMPAEARPTLRAPVIVVASRMLYDKGIGIAVEAARLLRARGLAFQLRLAGGCDVGNPNGIPEPVLRGWHQEGIATWLGHVSDMPECYRSADIACLPTHYKEGLPKALIEAASCGLPIVTTDTPGCREIAQRGVNALLVPTKDPAGVADALQRLIEDESLRRRLGAASRHLAVTSFSVEGVVASHMAIYDEIMRLNPRKGSREMLSGVVFR